MAAGKYSFTIEQGATTDFEIQYKDSNSEPINLEEYTAEMRIRTSFGSTSELLYASSSLLSGEVYNKTPSSSFLSVSGSNLLTPLSSGSIGVYFGYDTTDALSFTDALYDIELTSGSFRTRILQGKVKLSKDIT